MVENYVEAQNLEAHRVFLVIWLRRAIRMLEGRLYRDQSLSHDLLDLLPQFVCIHIWLVLSDVIKDRSHTSLVTTRVIVHVLVEYEILAILLNRIIS